MFMSDDKKSKMASLIISKVKKNPSEPESGEMDKSTEVPKRDGDEIADADQYDVAADEIFDAIEKKDKSGLKEAMKSFVEMCMNEEEDDKSDENV